MSIHVIRLCAPRGQELAPLSLITASHIRPIHLFFFNDTPPNGHYPPFPTRRSSDLTPWDGTFYLTQDGTAERPIAIRSEEHTSELQSRRDLVCRLLLEKKKKNEIIFTNDYVCPTCFNRDPN